MITPLTNKDLIGKNYILCRRMLTYCTKCYNGTRTVYEIVKCYNKRSGLYAAAIRTDIDEKRLVCETDFFDKFETCLRQLSKKILENIIRRKDDLAGNPDSKIKLMMVMDLYGI